MLSVESGSAEKSIQIVAVAFALEDGQGKVRRED